MSLEIELPDGTVLDAPDDADIKAVVAGYNRSRAPQTEDQSQKALGPWASAAVRPIAEGLGALPMLAADVGVGTRNAITGENYELPSKMFKKALDSYTTVPQSWIGKAPEFVSSALFGGVGGAPQAAAQVPAGFTRALPKAAAATGANEFLSRGIPLTMGQRGGKILKAAEDFAGNVPIVGPAIRARQQEALEAWNKSLLQQISDKVTKGGKEGFEQAGAAMRDAYSTIWKSELPFNRTGLRDQWTQLATQVGQKLPKQQAEEIVGTLRHQFGQILSGAREGGTQGATLESVDDALREAAKKAAKAGDGAIAGIYNQARSAFRDQFDPAVNAALKQTDELYMKLSTLRNAAKRSGWETFTPSQLLMAAKRKAGDTAIAEMRAPFQQEALKAADVLGAERSGAQAALSRAVGQKVMGPLGTAALIGGGVADLGTTALAATLGRLAYSKAGQKVITGLPKTTQAAVKKAAVLADKIDPSNRVLTGTLAQMEQ
jgi:hypothetical protein